MMDKLLSIVLVLDGQILLCTDTKIHYEPFDVLDGVKQRKVDKKNDGSNAISVKFACMDASFYRLHPCIGQSKAPNWECKR